MATATETIILKYEADTKSAQTNLDALDQDNEQVASSTASVNDQLDQMPGAAGAAAKGLKSVGAAMKAILLNPLGAVIALIVGSVVALGAAFKRTAGGGVIFEKVFAGISAAIGPVLDALGRFASGLVEIFQGNFSAGIDKMTGAFDGLGDAIGEAVRLSNELVDINQSLIIMNRDLIVQESELQLDMEKQRSILDDVSLSTEKRISANNRLNELNKELLKSRSDFLSKELEAAKKEAELAGDSKDEHDASLLRIAELTAAQNNAAAERFRVEKEFVVKRNELRALEAAQAKAIQDNLQQTLFDDSAEFDELEIEANFEKSNNELDAIWADYERKIAAEEEFQKVMAELDDKATKDAEVEKKARAQLDREELQSKLKIAQATVGLLGALENIAADSVAKQKAFAVAGALLSTFLAAAQVLADWKSLSVFDKIAGLIAITSVGLAQVNRITKVKVPGGRSSGGFSIPSISSTSISSSQNGFTNIDPTLPTNVNVINQQEQPPIRAYVMTGDVVTQTEAAKKLQQQTTL